MVRRVPPMAFMVPMMAICSAISIVTVFKSRMPLITTAISARMRNRVKMPSIWRNCAVIGSG